MKSQDQSTGKERLIIFDTTLRDGEQAPGCSMTLRQKRRVAQALVELGVDVIEAGFPAASPGDFEAVQTIAREIKGPAICGLARCSSEDIRKSAEALAGASRNRLHIFLATSPIHREHKLQMTKEQVLERAVQGVQLASEFFDDIEFSPEDAARTELDFLAEVVEAVITAGATTVNIPDTVGYTVPEEFARLFDYLHTNVPNVSDAVLSVHCHNDLGMAVANSLSAVQSGARQVECTINGIGERAGNCALEEIVMAVKTRAELFGVETTIDTRRLYPTSRLVSNITGITIPRNKAIVGDNAFAHEAGIHQHGMLKHSGTYEIMRPEDVGISRTQLVLGKHSGRHALRQRIEQLGFMLDDSELDRAFEEFKLLADKKKEIFDADIEAIVLQTEEGAVGPWQIDELTVSSGTHSIATAAIKMRSADGRSGEEAAVGIGPIDATVKAIHRIVGVHVDLQEMQIHSLTVGEDAQGEVSVTVVHEQDRYRGWGIGTDVVQATAHAVLQTINQVIGREQRAQRTQAVIDKALAEAS